MEWERDAPATGLSRLLAVDGRVLTRLAFVVRRCLALAKAGLVGLSAGTPKRATARPTAERLLASVQALPLTSIQEGRRRHYPLTPRATWHPRLLTRLAFPVELSTRWWADFRQPP
jgi:hypothetical protein